MVGNLKKLCGEKDKFEKWKWDIAPLRNSSLEIVLPRRSVILLESGHLSPSIDLEGSEDYDKELYRVCDGYSSAVAYAVKFCMNASFYSTAIGRPMICS